MNCTMIIIVVKSISAWVMEIIQVQTEDKETDDIAKKIVREGDELSFILDCVKSDINYDNIINMK